MRQRPPGSTVGIVITGMAAERGGVATTAASPMTGARFIVVLAAALSVSMAYGVPLPV